jgi:hypothetical protein
MIGSHPKMQNELFISSFDGASAWLASGIMQSKMSGIAVLWNLK